MGEKLSVDEETGREGTRVYFGTKVRLKLGLR